MKKDIEKNVVIPTFTLTFTLSDFYGRPIVIFLFIICHNQQKY